MQALGLAENTRGSVMKSSVQVAVIVGMFLGSIACGTSSFAGMPAPGGALFPGKHRCTIEPMETIHQPKMPDMMNKHFAPRFC
jgi:hypothetical protein